MMAVLFIFLYLLLITPIQLGIVVGRDEAFPRGAMGVMAWGFQYTVHFIGSRDENGQFHLKTTLPGKQEEKDRSLSPPSPRLFRFFKAFHASKGAWQIIRKGVHIKNGELHWIIGGENAAFLALLTGALQAFFSLSRRFSLHVHPFFQGKSRFRFRCIVETRLGTLLAAGLLGALHGLRAGKKEEKAWIIPSEI